jgi:hypothetical protein
VEPEGLATVAELGKWVDLPRNGPAPFLRSSGRLSVARSAA